ncbi:hypothetical protein ACJ2_26410 [Pantoea sp. QMID2]|nr:hypothetical protein ACJ1_28730 [Pantoea sp. QMID1]GME42287.1 hypothetical protein ACJ3_30000 [Pantoea sp. QMID3]GME57100.1 hypothetical protein ACJ4_25230 [Pantoea sp. QMID4]GME58662.1 hypothetical protein ACJ2_26410 [Pantoea sp. QMID2]
MPGTGNGCFVTGGKGVTSDFGGSDAQLTSNNAAASAAPRLMAALACAEKGLRVMINSSIVWSERKELYSR